MKNELELEQVALVKRECNTTYGLGWYDEDAFCQRWGARTIVSNREVIIVLDRMSIASYNKHGDGFDSLTQQFNDWILNEVMPLLRSYIKLMKGYEPSDDIIFIKHENEKWNCVATCNRSCGYLYITCYDYSFGHYLGELAMKGEGILQAALLGEFDKGLGFPEDRKVIEEVDIREAMASAARQKEEEENQCDSCYWPKDDCRCEDYCDSCEEYVCECDEEEESCHICYEDPETCYC